MGRRVDSQVFAWSGDAWQSVPSEHVRWVVFGWLPILELKVTHAANGDETGTAISRKYTWGLDLLQTVGGAGGIGGLLAGLDTLDTPTSSDDRTFAYFYDGNGNVTQLVETTGGTAGANFGTLAARYEYDPYGRPLLPVGDAAASGSYAATNTFRFSTKPIDPETSFSYFGYRYYSATMGRWISRDPLEEDADWHLSRFEANNPIENIDPFGLDWKVRRNKDNKRAEVIGDKGDTIASLAKVINMEPEKFALWLKATDDSPLPKSVEEHLCGRRTFSIPNVIFVGVGEMNSLSRWLTGSTPMKIRRILESKGFRVHYEDYDRIDPWKDAVLNQYGYDLYGLAFFGHGVAPGGLAFGGDKKIKSKFSGGLFGQHDALEGALDPSGDGTSGYVLSRGFYDGQFGFLALKSCFAAGGGWLKKVSSEARRVGAYWIGDGFEAAGVTWGMTDAAEAAK